MKKLVFLSVILVFMVALEPMMNTITAQDPIEGYVASLNEIVAGREGKVSNDVAASLLSSGQPIVFVSGSKVYFPVTPEGGNAASSLANLAEVAKVGVLGQTKRVSGLNFIVVQKARPMR